MPGDMRCLQESAAAAAVFAFAHLLPAKAYWQPKRCKLLTLINDL
jgi:hypothetical protein